MIPFKRRKEKVQKHCLKTLSIIVICIILLSLVITVFAHSGRTDSNGGHWNRATGEYHYHTGEYAGRESTSSTSWWSKWLFLFLISSAIGLAYYIWITVNLSLPHKIILNLENSIRNYKNAKHHTNFCNRTLKENLEKAIIPDGYEIGKDGLPKEIDNIDWGNSLTVYIVPDGWKLHLDKECCDSLFVYKRNVYSFYNKRYSLCKKCAENYQVPNMEWYIEYLKLDPQRKKCENARKEEVDTLNKLKICYNDSNKIMVRFFLIFTPQKKKKVVELRKEALYVQRIPKIPT